MKRIAVALVFIITAAASAQSSHPLSAPVDIELFQDHVKLLSPVEVIRAADDPEPPGLTPIQRALHARDRIFDNMVQVQLDVIVNENGRVESARPVDGPQRFYDQARAIEMRKEFEPIRRNGTIVRAHFVDYINVLPPERWKPNSTPFPANPNLGTLSISLQRTGCLGSCPSYTVTVDGFGNITFSSSGAYAYVAIPGTHHWHISQERVKDLVSDFHHARFLDALDSYQCGWTDLPSQTISLSFNGITHTVDDYGGAMVGMPSAVEALEDEIDAVTGSARWVKGNDESLPSLRAEHWNFSATSHENLALFDTAILSGNKDLIHLFVLAKPPIIGATPSESPVCIASQTGNVELVKQLLAAQPTRSRLPANIADECLSRAALAGSVPLVDLWLARGAHTNPPEQPDSQASNDAPPAPLPLIAAIQGGNPDVLARLLSAHADIQSSRNNNRSLLSLALGQIEDDGSIHRREDQIRIVHLLLNAGANVNEETDDDRAALYEVSSAPELIPELIAAGANVNMRNDQGETPLMYVSNPVAAKALLEAGADPTIKSTAGKTVVDMVRQWSCKECATLIQHAIAERNGPSGSQ